MSPTIRRSSGRSTSSSTSSRSSRMATRVSLGSALMTMDFCIENESSWDRPSADRLPPPFETGRHDVERVEPRLPTRDVEATSMHSKQPLVYVGPVQKSGGPQLGTCAVGTAQGERQAQHGSPPVITHDFGPEH